MNIGDKFQVTVEDKGKFIAEIINIDSDPVNSDREFELAITEMYRKDIRDMWYKCNDTFIEVEKAWFYAESKRKIVKIVEEQQLKIPLV